MRFGLFVLGLLAGVPPTPPQFGEALEPRDWCWARMERRTDQNGAFVYSGVTGGFTSPEQATEAARKACTGAQWFTVFHLLKTDSEPVIDHWQRQDKQFDLLVSAVYPHEFGHRVTIAGDWLPLLTLGMRLEALGLVIEQNALRPGELMVILQSAQDGIVLNGATQGTFMPELQR